MGGNEPGPEKGSATRDADSDETVYATKSRKITNQDFQTETAQQGTSNGLNEQSQQNETRNTRNLDTVSNPMPFPESASTSNDHSHMRM